MSNHNLPVPRAWRPPAARAITPARQTGLRPSKPAPPPASAEPEPGSPEDSRDLAWPFLIVLAYFFVDFARPQSWFPPLGALKPGVLALGGGLLTVLIKRNLVYFPVRAKVMAAFFGLMVLGTPFATNRYWAFICTKDFALLLFGAAVPLMSFVNTYSRMQRLVTFIILIHVPLALYGITHSGFGLGSFLGDENDFCLALNIILPYVFFSFYFMSGFPRKVALLLILGLLLVAITSTNSRGGFLGLIAAGIYCWLSSPRKVASLVLIAAVSGPVLLMVPQSYWDEMKTIETSTENDDTGAQRLYLWDMGWKMFKDHPILGVGPTNYQWNSFQYESVDQQSKGLHVWGKGAHSLYFTLLPEQGIVGTGMFVAILLLGFRDNGRIRRVYRALKAAGDLPEERLQQFFVLNILSRANDAAMIAYLVTGAFLSVLYYPHFWLQAAMGIALKRTTDVLLTKPVEHPRAIEEKATRRSWTPGVSRA